MDLFHFYFLNSDIPATLQVMLLKSSVCTPKVLIEESMSQMFDQNQEYDFRILRFAIEIILYYFFASLYVVLLCNVMKVG